MTQHEPLQRLIAGGRQTEAQRMLASMLRDRPDDIGLWRTQLRLAVSAGRMDDALVASRRVTEIDATDAVAWAQLGSLEQLVGRLDRAEKRKADRIGQRVTQRRETEIG